MSQIGIKEHIDQAIVYAFTLVVALIWKDIILDVIEVIVPTKQELLAKILTAIIATIFVIFIVYLFLRTESKAESVYEKIKSSARVFSTIKKADHVSTYFFITLTT